MHNTIYLKSVIDLYKTIDTQMCVNITVKQMAFSLRLENLKCIKLYFFFLRQFIYFK